MLARKHPRHRLLVGGVGVRVQEAHADGGDAAGGEPAGDGNGLSLIERSQLSAGMVDPPGHRLDPVRRNDPVRLHPEVGVAVPIGYRLAGDLQHELEALTGDEAQLADLAC
jgi:hypothetical protein